MKKQTPSSGSAVGGSSLLVIFGVLTLCVFAFLSLSTAQADRRLSDASAQAVTSYYEADRQAEEIFARLRAGEVPPTVTVSNTIYSYQYPISENQQLFVELSYDGASWEILRWQALAQPPDIAETMPVWDGEVP